VGTPALTLDLLSWADSRERSYEETIEAWKTSCPRLSIWDDAVIDGLVRIDRRSARGTIVVLTELGRVALASRGASVAWGVVAASGRAVEPTGSDSGDTGGGYGGGYGSGH
jgi:hypothetical protein